MNYIKTYINEHMRISVHAYNDKYNVDIDGKNAKILIGSPKRNACIEIDNLVPSVVSVGKLSVSFAHGVLVHSYNLQGVERYENPLRLIDAQERTYYVNVEFLQNLQNTAPQTIITTGRFGKISDNNMSFLLPITVKKYANE